MKILTPALPNLGPYTGRVLLGPLSEGDLVPAGAFTQPVWLEAAVQVMAGRMGTEDLRVAASLWSKQYFAAASMGALALTALHGIGLDMAPENIDILLKDGVPRAAVVRDTASAVRYFPRGAGVADVGSPGDLESLHRTVFISLFEGHLAPVIQALSSLSGASKAVLWGNLGNLVADVFDTLAATGLAPDAVGLDRRLLLESPSAVGLGDPNPLYGGVEYVALCEPDLPALVRVRRTCCQKHMTKAGPCTTCPRLSVAERVALLREKQ